MGDSVKSLLWGGSMAAGGSLVPFWLSNAAKLHRDSK